MHTVPCSNAGLLPSSPGADGYRACVKILFTETGPEETACCALSLPKAGSWVWIMFCGVTAEATVTSGSNLG